MATNQEIELLKHLQMTVDMMETMCKAVIADVYEYKATAKKEVLDNLSGKVHEVSGMTSVLKFVVETKLSELNK